MPDTEPGVTPDGWCTNTQPVSGTTRQYNGAALGGKFFKTHLRRYADCPCGSSSSLTERGNLRRHKPPRP
ncbi:hypothetical protein [Streptomyces sp. Tu 4128]|uniref:hypothetical protein n=1 Tax=Streptomyces sp. Tu 4128 TaxID=1120314 RepID=UPI000F01B657|nr:hypothetical protein [Streptomyces sp. Tu 4128]